MGRVKTIEIDPEKLRADLTKRGLGLKAASEEMGRSRSYMGNCIALRSMPVPAAKMLEMLYNISAESIMPDQIGGGYRRANFRGSWSGHGRAPEGYLSRV